MAGLNKRVANVRAWQTTQIVPDEQIRLAKFSAKAELTEQEFNSKTHADS
jgi:hypothetical protein